MPKNPGQFDSNAIHDNVTGEIAAVASKATPIGADLLLIEDSADANTKKRILISTLPAGGGAVPTTRNLTAGTGLTGGGDLSADRTFNVAANADGSIVANADDLQVGVLASDAQHGSRGGGTQHAAATDTVQGFIELATQAEVNTGTDAVRAVTPLTLATTPLAGRDTDAIHDNVAGEIAAITAKSPLVAGDLFVIEDSGAANVKKRTLLSTIASFVSWSLAQVLGFGNTTGGTDIIVSASDAVRFTEGTTPVTAANQVGIWNSDGAAADEQQNTLYATFESAGQDVAIAGATVFGFDSTATAGGQVYSDFEKLYQDVLRHNKFITSSAKVAGGGPWGSVVIVFLEASATMPARAANAAYDLGRVTIQMTGNLTLADGVNFSGSTPHFGMPFFAGRLGSTITAACTTTSLYSGAGPARMRFKDTTLVTGGSATVPALVFSSGTGFIHAWNGNLSNAGASALVHLTGTAGLSLFLYENAWILGNPITDDGGGNNNIFVRYVEPNTVGDGSGGSTPYQRTFGSGTAIVTFVPQAFMEGMGWISASPFLVPTFTPKVGGGFRNTYLSDALIKTPFFGSVIPGSTSTLIANGFIFTGVSHDALTASLTEGGWTSDFVTGAVATNSSGWATTTASVASMEAHAYAVFDFANTDTADIRFFVGLTGTHVGASRGGAIGTDTPTGHLLGLQKRDADTNYFFLTQQSAGAANRIDTGVAITSDNLMLVINCRVSGEVTLSLLDASGEELATHTESTAGNLPTASAALGLVAILETRTAATANWQHRHAQVSVGQYN